MHICDTSRHFTAQSKASTCGCFSNDTTDNNVGAGTSISNAILIPATLNRYNIIASAYVAVLNADIRARIWINSICVR
eukprot:Gb_27996 [translate_table: standard]